MAIKNAVNKNNAKEIDLKEQQKLDPSNPDEPKDESQIESEMEKQEVEDAQENAEAEAKAEQERLEKERQQTEEALRREAEKQKKTITMLNPNLDAEPKEAEVHPDMVGNWEMEGWKVK